jgi:hypothetical protein
MVHALKLAIITRPVRTRFDGGTARRSSLGRYEKAYLHFLLLGSPYRQATAGNAGPDYEALVVEVPVVVEVVLDGVVVQPPVLGSMLPRQSGS